MDHAQKLFDWGVRTAIPYWLTHAWDDRNGGFLESVTMSGAPVFDDTRRVRTQARQVHVFACAAHEGWADSLGLAVRGMETLRERAWSPDGRPGWVHLLRPDGRVESDVRDFYDHAFILLALAGLYRASGEGIYLDWAAECLDFLDDEMSSTQGGYIESIGARVLPRRQNPHMHLFEALMALYEATGDTDVLDRATAIKSMFETVFMDAETGLLRENFAGDWSSMADDAGDISEPGHMSEWGWLLAEYARLSGTAPSTQIGDLFKQVMAAGINRKSGALYTSIRFNGDVRDGGSRTWMQTEWVRAAAAQGPEAFDTACAALLKHHIDPAYSGGWVDRIDDQGRAASDHVPTSTLYHLMGCVLEARQFAIIAANAPSNP
jgi:mannose/cellobiose epimerase-like protein (N-acyl-D-glucosamine 2-epimerase family)